MKNIMTIFIIGLIAIVGSMILLFFALTRKSTTFIHKESEDFRKNYEIKEIVNSPYYTEGTYNLLISRGYIGYKAYIYLYFSSFIHKDSISNIKGIELNNVEILINDKKFEDFKLKNLNKKFTYSQSKVKSELYSCTISFTNLFNILEDKDDDKMVVKLNVTFHRGDNTTLNKQFKYTLSTLSSRHVITR